MGFSYFGAFSEGFRVFALRQEGDDITEFAAWAVALLGFYARPEGTANRRANKTPLISLYS